ncbi:hypothetical protein ACRAKI_16175 [Saccharothrix isguenensis]
MHSLADHQGVKVDELTEEEPGRILHEVRLGRAAALALDGGGAYYGTAEASPLFVALLGELHRWGLPLAEVQAYVYAAYTARTQTAVASGDERTAAEYRRKVSDPKAAFNEQFWLPEQGWFAFSRTPAPRW